MRCVHESSLYEENSFITLTYNPDNVPKNGSLNLKDFQDFMKRLRKSIEPKKLRFFHCGEYGEKYNRPHYHAILFGHDFADKIPYKKNQLGNQTWTAPSLDSLWPMGLSVIGSVTFESAAYVARYCVEKIEISDRSPKKIRDRFNRKYLVSEKTGELRPPEYCTMSRRPGIGRGWYNKFSSDIYPRDYAIMRGMKVRPPKFYDGLFEIQNPLDYSCIKKQRVAKAIQVDPSGYGENGGIRLAVKEEVKLAQLRTVSRSMEE